MLLNYLKLSLRLMVRNPFMTLINVGGLSIGFVAFFILWQYSTSELRSDQFHKDYVRIARIGAHWRWVEEGGKEGMLVWGNIMSYQGAMIFSDIPQIEKHCRFIYKDSFNPEVVGVSKPLIFSADRGDSTTAIFSETRVISADTNLFEFFTIPLVRGNKKTVLKNANSAVLSVTAAARYFGKENPVNRLLKLNDSITLVVTGVFKDLPRSTHLNFDIVLSNAGRELQWANPAHFLCWTETYIKVSESNEFKKIENQINARKERYWGTLQKNYPDGHGDMFIQPLQEIAFSNIAGSGIGLISKSRSTLYILKAVAITVLVMAWINFMNLSVSRITRRSQEIAARKVTGARHPDFLKQFLVESVLLNGIAIAMAFTLIQVIRLPLQVTFDMAIPPLSIIPFSTWSGIVAFALSGIAVTTMFPVFLSMRYSPRKLQIKQEGATWMKILPATLTTLQYGAAFVLVSWVFVTYSQLNHILDQDFLKKDQVIVVEAPLLKTGNFLTDMNGFMNMMKSHSTMTFSSTIIGDGSDRFGMRRKGSTEFNYYNCNGGVDGTFLPFFGIPLLAGRNFIPTDRPDAMLISRIACARLGFEDVNHAIGSILQLHEIGASKDQYTELEIVGIYEDYPILLAEKLSSGTDADNNPLEGTCLFFKNGVFDHLLPERIEFLVNRENFKGTLSNIEETFHSVFPSSIFNWYFLEDHVSKGYWQKKLMRNQIALFTALAIVVACLGLLGNITNNAEDKTKEIGIRKVLGAGLRPICAVLLHSTSKQILVAVLLALPLAVYLGRDYLRQYRDQISLQWWHFASPAAMLVFILMSTIAVVLYKAATGNPVEALKHE